MGALERGIAHIFKSQFGGGRAPFEVSPSLEHGLWQTKWLDGDSLASCTPVKSCGRNALGKAILLLILFSSLCPPSMAGEIPRPSWTAASFQGYWQDVREPDFLLGFEGAEMTVAFQGRVREAGMILKAGAEGMRVCLIGREDKLSLTPQEGRLVFRDEKRGKTRELRRVDGKPGALSRQMTIPGPVPLSEERIASIQREIRRRNDAEQELLLGPRGGAQKRDLPWLETTTSMDSPARPESSDLLIAARTTANTEYLRSLIAEVGWIDAARFGYGASNAAFLLLQHSWDLPLMLAVLPRLKADVDAGLMEKEPYALLYDRAQLARGLRQRYGSQVVREETGEVIVLPVEGPDQVDARRKEMGMIPLRQYVAIFGAPDVKISSACSP